MGLPLPRYAGGLATLEANHRTQRGLGADIALLDPAALKARFPWLKTDDLAAGTLGLSNEGWIDPYSLLQAFRRKARALGAVYLTDEAVGIERHGNRIEALTLAQGGGSPAAIWWIAPAITPMRSRPWPGSSCRSGRASVSSSSSTARSRSSGRRC
jgi:Glycine/D-amino acid oxidases (deaminating)